MDFDETRLYYSHQQLHQTADNDNDIGTDQQQQQQSRNNSRNNAYDVGDDNDEGRLPVDAMHRHLVEFLRNYQMGTTSSHYVYRERLLKMHRKGQSHVNVDLAHVGEYDPTLW
jgi:MCM N-terminal domain